MCANCSTPEDIFLRLPDFNGSTSTYRNILMKSLRYRLLRDKDVVMERGIDYANNSNGGFDLLNFQMDNTAVIGVQFY